MSASIGKSADRQVLWDLLRLFLVLQVVLGHMGSIFAPRLADLSQSEVSFWVVAAIRLFFGFGELAAYLFILVSGYFVGQIYLGNRSSNSIGWNLVISRLWKLYPTIIGALMFTTLLDALGSSWSATSGYYSAFSIVPIEANTNVLNWICTAFSLQPVVTAPFGSNGPLWTLGYIVQFYVLGYFVLSFSRVAARAVSGVILPVVLACISLEWGILFALWLFGAWLPSAKKVTEQYSNWRFILLALGFFILSKVLESQIALVLLAAALGSALIFVPRIEGIPPGARKIIETTSGEAFAVYAYHFPIAVFVAAAFIPSLGHSVAGMVVFFAVSFFAFLAIIVFDRGSRRLLSRTRLLTFR